MSQLPIDIQTLPMIDNTASSIDRRPPMAYRVQLPKIDVTRLNAIRNSSQPSENIADNFSQHSDDAPESMQVDQTSKRRTLRRRKEKIPRHLKRGVNEKEMDSFTKRVLRIPLDKPFEEAYFAHGLWMFFRETKETEQNIHRIFNHIRKKMKQMITLKKKSDLGKFAVPCLVKVTEFSCALCDSGSSVSILPKIGNALVSFDFHVLDNKLSKNHFLLLVRAFMAIVGAVCNMQTNQLCLTLINSDFYYDPVRIVKPQTSNTGTQPSIDRAVHPTIDNHSRESIDSSPANETFALPEHCYPSFAFNTHPKTSIDYHHYDTINRHVDYPIGSWPYDSHHESFAVDTALPEMQYDEYDEDYHRDMSTMVFPWMIENFPIHRHARAMDGRILNISKDDIAEIIAMNGSKTSWTRKTELRIHHRSTTELHHRSTISSMSDEERFIRIGNGNLTGSTQRYPYRPCQTKPVTAKQRLMRWLDGVYYPPRDDIDSLTKHMNALQQEMDTIQRQLDFQAEPLPLIDRRTRPSIDSERTSLRGKLVTEKVLQDNLDEITFSQDLL
ncbi:hypothetical protein DY000_02016650 [Brassica cretica]|uniref:Aspartic peptidase DDI1-type domain-containing protein n=1 Tax=Brassica cretica TaxID=69181 RepID=A0ABQ7D0S6_BRACR|nr:hypothetical protein DY000_02016650 [Brassica cretica]